MKRTAAEKTATDGSASQQPLYQMVLQVLRDEILSGRYDAAGALPSELALEERFEVSRITIRRACDELERAALIKRSKGRSARLLPRLPPVVTNVEQEIETLKAQAIDMRPKVLHFAWIIPDASLRETLEVPQNEKVLWVTRLLSRRRAPVSHTSVYIPQKYGVGISEDLLGRMQLIDLWKSRGLLVHSAEQIMTAAPASMLIAKLLHLDPGAPLFCIRRLMRAQGGKPMGLLYASLRWDRFSYNMSLTQNNVELQASAATKRKSPHLQKLILEI